MNQDIFLDSLGCLDRHLLHCSRTTPTYFQKHDRKPDHRSRFGLRRRDLNCLRRSTIKCDFGGRTKVKVYKVNNQMKQVLKSLKILVSRPLTSFSKSPPIKVAQHERSAPSLSTFMNTDELQPDHPLPSGRLSPYLPSLRSTLRRSQPMISPGQQRLIPVHTPKVPSGESLDSVDDSLKDL